MKALIFGISGFIGSHLAGHLGDEGWRVFGTHYRNRKKNDSRVRSFQCNILNANRVQKIIKRVQPQWIFCLSGQSSIVRSWHLPGETLKVNIFGVLNVLEAIKKFRSKARLVVISSCAVYGDSFRRGLRLDETGSLRPKDLYGLAKMSADLLTQIYAKNHNLDAVVIRLFNLAGPGQIPIFSISNFAYQIARIERGVQLPRMHVGNLRAWRDFTDVRDGVQAIRLAASKGKKGEVYHIASGHSYSLRDLLERLIQLSGVDKKIKIIQDISYMSKDEMDYVGASAEKFMSLTGWRPKIPMRRTLLDTLNFWRGETQ